MRIQKSQCGGVKIKLVLVNVFLFLGEVPFELAEDHCGRNLILILP